MWRAFACAYQSGWGPFYLLLIINWRYGTILLTTWTIFRVPYPVPVCIIWIYFQIRSFSPKQDTCLYHRTPYRTPCTALYGTVHMNLEDVPVCEHCASTLMEVIEQRCSGMWVMYVHANQRNKDIPVCKRYTYTPSEQYIKKRKWAMTMFDLRGPKRLLQIRFRFPCGTLPETDALQQSWHFGCGSWIRGSRPLTNGSGFCYFRHWPSRRQQKTNLIKTFFLLITFWRYITIIFQR
jgi:hypothetical protein